MNKRIVILALHLGTGGAERVIASLANLLSEKYNVKIISTYQLNDKPSFYLNDNVEIEYLINDLKPNREELRNSIKQFKILTVFKESLKSLKILYLKKHLMIKAIKKLDCDIVISTRIFHNKLVNKYAKKSIIRIAQEHNHHNNNKKYIKKLIKSLSGFDYFMPVSSELANYYSEKVNGTKTIYIPNFIENIPEKKSSLTNKQFVSVGRLDKIKGFEDLVDIFYLVQEKYPSWRLHIVGDGEEKEKLQNKINKLNLNKKIFLTGIKLNKELEEEYIDSSIYLMTSFSESFGLVLIEAASYGLPLIAFDSAQGAKEIIKNNENGFLIADRNKENYVIKIFEIIENEEIKKKISNNALETAKKYSKNLVAEKWYEFIDELGDKNEKN